MDNRRMSVVLIVVGIVIVALSAFGDSLGFGASSDFGWKQVAGVVVGAVLVVAGVVTRALGGRTAQG